MHVRVELVTPAMAMLWLQKNTHNRPMSLRIVKRYTDDMRNARWKTNGDSIRFSGHRLLDGQKRLQAIINSGVSQTFVIIQELDDDVFDTLDGGERRSAADTLAVLGEKNYATLSAAVVIVERYYTSQMTVARRSVPNWRIVELLDKYPDLRESVNIVCATKKCRLITPSLESAMHFVFSRFDKVAADTFMTDVKTGSNLVPGDSVLCLRERLINNLSSKSKLNQEYIAALMIKAWNHRRDGIQIKYLRYRESGPGTEPFPIAR